MTDTDLAAAARAAHRTRAAAAAAADRERHQARIDELAARARAAFGKIAEPLAELDDHALEIVYRPETGALVGVRTLVSALGDGVELEYRPSAGKYPDRVVPVYPCPGHDDDAGCEELLAPVGRYVAASTPAPSVLAELGAILEDVDAGRVPLHLCPVAAAAEEDAEPEPVNVPETVPPVRDRLERLASPGGSPDPVTYAIALAALALVDTFEHELAELRREIA